MRNPTHIRQASCDAAPAQRDAHRQLRRHLLLWPAAAALATHRLAGAQSAAWPAHPVKLTVAFAPGGTVMA